MLTQFGLTHFKSYDDEAVLVFGRDSPLSVLIGANASGKSNLLEGLRLLSTIVRGAQLHTIRPGQIGGSLRGPLTGLGFGGSRVFSFHCQTNFEDYPDYRITLELRDEDRLHIRDERIEGSGTVVPLFEVVSPASGVTSDIEVAYDNFARGGKKPRIRCTDQMSVLAQLQNPAPFPATHKKARETVPKFARCYQNLLENIIFLDPRPEGMRGYSYRNEVSLSENGNNLSGVLYNLCRKEGSKARVLAFVRDLPEQNIEDIVFLDTPRGDVMVALKETFGGTATQYDASQLSDGTLRILAVASAVLSAPENGIVVVEEIDNGVHPSRVETLLERIAQVATDRRLQILITTHNPALLDALPSIAVPQVVFCYRDKVSGSSRLIRLEDIPDYPKLVIQGPLGRLLTTRALDSFVKHRLSSDELKRQALAWVEEHLRDV
ncbi:MAG: AAA family ATPase [Deltaproteobacteria bacterium]|nr:AAA family ATPase [Deltaproteobacteria bacterium]